MKKLKGVLAALTICAVLTTSISGILLNGINNDGSPGNGISIMGTEPDPRGD